MEPQALEGPQPLNAVRAVIDEYPLIVRSRNVPTQIGPVGDAGFERILAGIVVENCSLVIGQGESGIRGQFLGIKDFVELVQIERRVQDCNGPARQVGNGNREIDGRLADCPADDEFPGAEAPTAEDIAEIFPVPDSVAGGIS